MQRRFACLRRNLGAAAAWFEEFYSSQWGVPLEDVYLHILQTALLQLSEQMGISIWDNKTGHTWMQATLDALQQVHGNAHWTGLLARGVLAFCRMWARQPFMRAYPPALVKELQIKLDAKPTKASVGQALTLCARLRDYAFLAVVQRAHEREKPSKVFVIPIGEGHIWHFSKLLREAGFQVHSGQPQRCKA